MNIILGKENVNKQVKIILDKMNMQMNETNYKRCALIFINTAKSNSRLKVSAQNKESINNYLIKQVISASTKLNQTKDKKEFLENGNIGDFKLERDKIMYNAEPIHVNDRSKMPENTKKKNGQKIDDLLSKYYEENKRYGIQSPQNIKNPQQQNQKNNSIQTISTYNTQQNINQITKIPDNVLQKLQDNSQSGNVVDESKYLTNNDSITNNLNDIMNERKQNKVGFNNDGNNFNQYDEKNGNNFNQHNSNNQYNNVSNNENNFNQQNNRNEEVNESQNQNNIPTYDENIEFELEFFSSLNKEERNKEIQTQNYKVRQLHKTKPNIVMYALQFFNIETLDKIIIDLSQKIINFHDIDIPVDIAIQNKIKYIFPLNINSSNYKLILPKELNNISSIKLLNYEYPMLNINDTCDNISIGDHNIFIKHGKYSLKYFLELLRIQLTSIGFSINKINNKVKICGKDIFKINKSKNSILNILGFNNDSYENYNEYVGDILDDIEDNDIHLFVVNISQTPFIISKSSITQQTLDFSKAVECDSLHIKIYSMRKLLNFPHYNFTLSIS